MLSVSLIKEAFEDWVSILSESIQLGGDFLSSNFDILLSMQKRFKNDRTINSTRVDILRGGTWKKVPWRNLAVGDVVKVPFAALQILLNDVCLVFGFKVTVM